MASNSHLILAGGAGGEMIGQPVKAMLTETKTLGKFSELRFFIVTHFDIFCNSPFSETSQLKPSWYR